MVSFDIYLKPNKTRTNRCHSRFLSLCPVKCLHKMSKFFLRAVRGNCTSFPCASPDPCPAPFRKSHSRRKHRKKSGKKVLVHDAFVQTKIRGSQVFWTFSFSAEWNCICRFFSTEMPLTLDSFPQSWMADLSRETCSGWHGCKMDRNELLFPQFPVL